MCKSYRFVELTIYLQECLKESFNEINSDFVEDESKSTKSTKSVSEDAEVSHIH